MHQTSLKLPLTLVFPTILVTAVISLAHCGRAQIHFGRDLDLHLYDLF